MSEPESFSDWLARRGHYLSITLDEDGGAKVAEVGDVPRGLAFEQIRPAFDWAIAQIDAEPAVSL